MIDRVIALLQQTQLDLSAEDIADALWLARYLEAEEATVEVEELMAESAPIAAALDQEPLPLPQTEFIPSEPKALIYPSEPVASPLPAAPKSQGISFQAPAAAALRTPLDLARSLRPLMRRVESRTNLVLDEEATAEEIADREVWSPVLRPDRERWLELAIVVEASRSTAIWQSTVAEFQKLMEVQGAFRDVRTWSLTTREDGKLQLFPRRGTVAVQHRPRSPKELIDPAGRRLILVVSDCISPVWRQGQIHPLLKQWSEAGPLAIVQLLPERLWVRSALGTGFPVQLSALSPGVANSKLQVEGLLIWEEIHLATAIPLPVITLEPEPLHQWAKVVAGIGSTQTAGIVFDSSLLALQLQAESEMIAQTAADRLSSEELVKRFRATASPIARKLAGLMAAAPVSLPVVHLLQETLLKDSRQVHVAEVFMSGLLQTTSEPTSEATETVQYEFVDGVRDILLDAVPAPKIDAVLEAVSQYVADRAGLSIRNFAALLVPRPEWKDSTRQTVLPFAEIAKHVLQRLGGEYARVAEQLEQTAQGIAQRFREIPLDLSAFPKLRSFEFEVATFTEEDSPSVPEWKKQIVRSLQGWMQAYLALEREYERAEQFAPESNAISQRVRSLRVRPGYCMEQVRAAFNNEFSSQNALAEAAGVTRSTVHEFLTGELINRATFDKLCRHLSLNPEEIADRDPNNPSLMESDTAAAYRVAFHNAVTELEDPDFQILLDSIWSERESLTQQYTQLTQDYQSVQQQLRFSSNTVDRERLEKQLKNINKGLGEIDSRLRGVEAEIQNQIQIEALHSYLRSRLGEWLETDIELVNLLAIPGINQYLNRLYRDTSAIQDTLFELYEASLNQLERSSSEQASAQRQRRDVIRLALSQVITGLAVILVSDTFLLSPYASLTLGCAGIAQAKDSLTSRPLQTFEFTTIKVDARGQEIQRKRLTVQFYVEDLGNEVRLEMVTIPGGIFEMGSSSDEPKRRNGEGCQHLVKVLPFFMGKYPVTQAQWRVVAGLLQVNRELNPTPSEFKGDDRPVERVSWYDAIEFCDRLSRLTGREYRLPTEAEWEYACRARTTTPFYFGETITSNLANYRGTSTYRQEPEGEHRKETTAVGRFPPNEFGLFDMHGNVWEWCADHWHESYDGAPTDGSAWLTDNESSSRLLRGGSWDGKPEHCRSAIRFRPDPDYRFNLVGFRVVCSSTRIL